MRRCSSAEIERICAEFAPVDPHVNDAENAFLARLKSRGDQVDVIRRGWPDFVLADKATGRIYGVEVKLPGDKLRPSQRKTFALLERLGIPVYVWCPRWPDRLRPWRKHTGLTPHQSVGADLRRAAEAARASMR